MENAMNIRRVVLALSLILAIGAVDAKSHRQPPQNSSSKEAMPDGSGKPKIQQLGEYCDTAAGRFRLSSPQMLGSACSVNTPSGVLQGTVGG